MELRSESLFLCSFLSLGNASMYKEKRFFLEPNGYFTTEFLRHGVANKHFTSSLQAAGNSPKPRALPE
jgi:hypothetical protein